MMKNYARLLFEANHLKKTPRSGFAFLGAGKESVAEHSFSTTFIAFLLSKIEPQADPLRLITMCLVHDLPESRIGDINYVQKKYVTADESEALKDCCGDIPVGSDIEALISEFNKGESLEAQLAWDADQVALIVELKTLLDIGYDPPQKWIPHVLGRIKTDAGKQLTETILNTDWDEWWFQNYIDR
jgi:putative hydrolase of HD superfamily